MVKRITSNDEILCSIHSESTSFLDSVGDSFYFLKSFGFFWLFFFSRRSRALKYGYKGKQCAEIISSRCWEETDKIHSHHIHRLQLHYLKYGLGLRFHWTQFLARFACIRPVLSIPYSIWPVIPSTQISAYKDSSKVAIHIMVVAENFCHFFFFNTPGLSPIMRLFSHLLPDKPMNG